MRPRQPDYIGRQNAEPINSRSIESYGRAAAGGVTGMLGGAKIDAMSLSLPAAPAFRRRLPNRETTKVALLLATPAFLLLSSVAPAAAAIDRTRSAWQGGCQEPQLAGY